MFADSVNGVASCSNDFFNNQLMRKEWGLSGFVVSDCGEIRGLDVEGNHGTTAHPYTKQRNGTMSCQAALRGGCDVDCGSVFDAHMLDALAVGNVATADVELAARHVLKPTLELGLLDGPDAPYRRLGPDDVDTTEHRQLALEAGQQGITLLKNDKRAGAAKPLLPLSKTSSVAVVGPALNFTQEMLSNYAGWNTVVDEHSPWMALRQRLGSRLVSAALGCERQVITMFGVVSCDVHDNGTSAITAAVTAAKAADTVLLFVGTNPIGNVLSCPPGSATCRLTTEAEGVDRVSLELPGVQPDLIRAVHAANPNVVLVMLNGGPLAIEWPAAHVPAIVEAFFPGELGGDAIASVLMGDVSPTGRLPVTVYPADFIARNMTDYDLASGNGTTHLYYRGKPVYPFSWGKSYSQFGFALADGTEEAERELSALSLASEAALLRYSVRVTNVGGAAAAVAVQAFLSSAHADAVTNEELVDFAKSGVLQPGASETIRLTVPRERLALIDDLGDERIAPGDYTLRFGGHGSGVSREMDFVEARLHVTGEARYMWRLSRARAAWRASTGSESHPDDLQRVTTSIRPRSGAGLKTDDRQLTAPPRPLLRNAPNIYGGSSFGRNELYQDCTGSMFAFSGADGPTNERSHFVAFWAPQRWTLRWCGMNVPAANSTLTAAFHPDSNVADERVEVATSDVLVVRHRTLHRDLVMVWARWNLLVGRADAITLQGASPVGGHGSTCGCVQRRTPIGWLVLCHDKGSTLQFAVAFDTSNLVAAIDAAQQATCGTAVDVDDTVARRLAPLDALPTLPNATLDRLSKKVYSIARLNTLSSEGAVRQHWATPDKSPHQMEYPWDTAFHAWGQLEVRPKLAAEMLTSMLDGSNFTNDGVIPSTFVPWLPQNAPSDFQAPLLCWVSWEVFQKTQDRDWLGRSYLILARHIEWILANRGQRDGLLHYAGSGTESAMDNSPVFRLCNDLRNCTRQTHRPNVSSLAAPDLSTWVANEMKYLAMMAASLGDSSASARWRSMSAQLSAKVHAQLWDETDSYYYFRNSSSGGFLRMMSVAGFWPMLLDGVPPERVTRLVAHLHDPKLFATPAPLPTVARSDPAFSRDMFRGPTWINLNFLTVRALERQAHVPGAREAAAQLRIRTIDLVARHYARYGSVFEFYDALDTVPPTATDRKGHKACGGIRDYHFTAACVFALLHSELSQ